MASKNISEITEAMHEMALPHHLLGSVERNNAIIWKLKNHDAGVYPQVVTMLTANWHKMSPDIDFIYTNKDAKRIRDFFNWAKEGGRYGKGTFIYLKNKKFKEHIITDPNMEKFIQYLNTIIDDEMASGYFNKIENVMIADFIEKHIGANVYKIAILLYELQNNDKLSTNISMMTYIIMADFVILYDHMQFDAFSMILSQLGDSFTNIYSFCYAVIPEKITMNIFTNEFTNVIEASYMNIAYNEFHIYSTMKNMDSLAHMDFEKMIQEYNNIRNIIFTTIITIIINDKPSTDIFNDEFGETLIIRLNKIYKRDRQLLSNADDFELATTWTIYNMYTKRRQQPISYTKLNLSPQDVSKIKNLSQKEKY